MANGRGSRAAVVLLLLGSLGIGTFAYYVKTTPEAVKVAPEIRRERPDKKQSNAGTAEPRNPDVSGAKVRLVAFGDSDVSLESSDTAVPKGDQPMHFVASQVISAANLDGVRVLGIDVRDHVAVVDFNSALEKGMGSMEEGMFLKGLQVAFGQFTEIDKVMIEVNGAPLTSGHVDLSEALPVIRPGESEPTSAEGSTPAGA